MTWLHLATLSPKPDWQYTSVVEGDFFRIRTIGNIASLIALRQAQTIAGVEFWGYQRVLCRPEATIIQLPKPPFFDQRKLAIVSLTRVESELQTIAIEVSDMPISNPPTVTVNLPSAATVTPATVASSITSVALVAANANRKGLTIYNNSTARLYVDHDAAASLTDFTVMLEPGGFYEVPREYAPLALSGIWASANGNALVREFV